MPHWSRLFEIAEPQRGAVAIRQALEIGSSRQTLDHRARRERWRRPHRGVVIVPGVPDSFEQRVWAAILAVGGDVLVGRRTAAYLLGIIDRPPARIELVVPYRRDDPQIEGVDVWRSRTLLRRDRRIVDGLPVTSPARTLCDLAAVLPVQALRSAVIDARQRRLTSVRQALRRSLKMAGAPGLPKLRRVAYEVDEAGADSTLAWRARQILIAAGLRPDRGEHPVRASNGVTVHIDVPFVAYRVGVEPEGMGGHSRRRDLDRDIRRRNTLRLTEWTIIWLSRDRLEEDPEGFVAEVRAELERRGWPGPPLL